VIFAPPLQNLRSVGYDVGQLPGNDMELIQSVLQAKEAKFNSADLNIAYRMPVAEYQQVGVAAFNGLCCSTCGMVCAWRGSDAACLGGGETAVWLNIPADVHERDRCCEGWLPVNDNAYVNHAYGLTPAPPPLCAATAVRVQRGP
jgi:hypothetical protein